MVTGQAMSIFHQSFRSLLISLFQSKKLLYKIPHCFSNGWIRPPILPDWPLYEGSLAGLVWFHQTPGPVGLPGNLQTRFHFPQKKQLGRNNVKLHLFLLLLSGLVDSNRVEGTYYVENGWVGLAVWGEDAILFSLSPTHSVPTAHILKPTCSIHSSEIRDSVPILGFWSCSHL